MEEIVEARIPVRSYDSVRKKFVRINNELKKKGLPPFELETIDSGETSVSVELDGEVFNFQVAYYDIKVTGSPFQLGKHKLLAYMDQTKTPPQLHTYNGYSQDSGICLDNGDCDHCKKPRQRNRLFLLESEEGEKIRVGGECAKDYFSGLTPERVASALSVEQEAYDLALAISREMDEYTKERALERKNSGDMILPTEFVALSIRHLEKHPFVSKSSLDKHSPDLPTSSLIAAEYENWEERGSIPDELGPYLDKARALIKSVSKRLDKAEESSDFLINLKNLVDFKGGYVDRSYAGYLVYLPIFEQKAATEQRISARESQYVGMPGEPYEALLEYTGSHSYNSKYGLGWIHSFFDEDGNQIKNFSSSGPDKLGLTGNRWVFAKSKVKDHQLYRGEFAQTQVKNLTVEAAWKYKPEEDEINRRLQVSEMADRLALMSKKDLAYLKKNREKVLEDDEARSFCLHQFSEKSGFTTTVGVLERWIENGIPFDDIQTTLGSDLFFVTDGQPSEKIALTAKIKNYLEDVKAESDYKEIYDYCVKAEAIEENVDEDVEINDAASLLKQQSNPKPERSFG